jgi:hypothetical protein
MLTVWEVVKAPPSGEMTGAWRELEPLMVKTAEAIGLQLPGEVSTADWIVSD